MFSLLADSLMNATRQKNYPETKDWADRFVPDHRRRQRPDPYKFNPYRDLW